MYKTAKFKKKILATLVASSTLGLSGYAFAQEGDEIVITGIKASLQRAVDIKRDAAGVVDAISSEDIGKMPDANLSESLQRITGVSIDRNNGEGARVTARGFGPSFNLVTYNGRQLSSTVIGADGTIDASRSFDMSNIASESVSGVQVYKTGKASVPTGGIGATINLSTARPLDHEGFKGSIGGKALYDESADINDQVTPELSGFASWSNEIFGASLSLTHQERNSGRSGFQASNGWGNRLVPYAGSSIFNGAAASANAVKINEPALGQLASRLDEARFYHIDAERTRDNALLTLQYKPSDKITTTFDYLTAETDSRTQLAMHSLWFSDDAFPVRGVQWDNSPVTSVPLYIWQAPNSGTRDIALKNELRSFKSKLEDVGFNVAIEATDSLSFDIDVHHSKSSILPLNAPGTSISLGLGAQGTSGQGIDLSGDLPLVVGLYSDVNDKKLTAADVGSTVSQLVNARVWADVKEAKVEGKYEFAESGSINFGISALQTEQIQKQSDIGNQLMKGGWNVTFPGDVPASDLEQINFNDYFDGYNTNLSAQSKAFFNSAGFGGANASTAVPLIGFRVKDFNKTAKNMFAAAPGAPAYAANPVDSTDRKLSEDITALFVETNLEGTLGGMKVDVSAGLRYESTDVDSEARVANRIMVWSAERDFSNNAVPGDVPYKSQTYHYSNLLPNVDLTFHISDDLIARASTSKTISRASYGNLQQGAAAVRPQAPTILGGAPGSGTDGNVSLKPVESNNIDFSVEYYFNDTDYVSLGYFNKRVPNFIGTASERIVFPDSLDPSSGPRTRAALAELDRLAPPRTEQNLFQMMGSMNTTAQGCVNAPGKDLCGKPFNSATYTEWVNSVDIIPVAGDSPIVNNVLRPVNSKDAELSGWELAGQYFFGDSGFGVQANYTVVSGSIGYDIYANPGISQFALTGLSDSANLIGIYEKDQWQARIAYNWRDEFLNGANVGNGEPELVRDYGQVDISVGYKFTENLTVSFEGTNMLGEDRKTFGRTETQVRALELFEPRYALSARYSF